jgi:hypothetical protein
MKKQTLTAAIILFAVVLFYSCQKSMDDPTAFENDRSEAAKPNLVKPDITSYQFERINENNFYSQGWKEQQVNIVSGTTIFSDQSDYVEIICGPEDNSDPRLIKGCVTMNLPTSDDPTLRRIRLRRGGYSGTRLADLTELKYSTYVIRNAPTIMVLQVDINNDEAKDFNIFYNPVRHFQGDNFPPILFNTWQQWDALYGIWHIEVGELPEFPDGVCTIQELISIPKYANARIIDTAPVGHNGEGVRFTIGGTPRELFDNTIGYFDALIIGTKDQQHSTLYDFACNDSHN